MAEPRVSVVTTTYNRVHCLPRAIESVLTQSFSDWELILVDNGSTDGTDELIRQYQRRDHRIRYVTEERKGISPAGNRGLQEARGEFITFIDDDDEWLPEKLARQIAFFESHPQTGLLYTQAYVKDAKGEVVGVKPRGSPALTFTDLIEEDKIPHLTVMVRRQCVEKMGAFDDAIEAAQDYDLWLRISQEFPLGFLPEPLAIYQYHGGNASTQHILKRYQATLFIFNKLLKSCRDPFLLARISRRLAFRHYLSARGYLYFNKLPEAKSHLERMRALIRSYPFSGGRLLFLRSLALSWLLGSGSVVRKVLRWRWQHREPAYFTTRLYKEGTVR